jgi:site-specific DNA-methyltransferase (adenine-specific)
MIYALNADFKSLDPSTFEGIDHMITDPPYSGHTHANATSTGNSGRGPVERDFGFACLAPEDRDACVRIAARLPRWTAIFSDFAKGSDEFGDDPEAQAQAGHYIIEGDCAWRFAGVHAGLEWIRLIPWVRWSQPQITGDRPPTGCEAVLHFHGMGAPNRNGKRKPIAKHWNGSGGLTHYTAKSLRGDDKHPTEKPLDLMLDLVCFYTDPGEAVLDPFAGRGTTGQACRILGRDAILVERDPAWAAQAEARVNSPLDERDRAAVETWIERTAAEVEKTRTDPTSTENALRRAQCRADDVARARTFLAEAA